MQIYFDDIFLTNLYNNYIFLYNSLLDAEENIKIFVIIIR